MALTVEASGTQTATISTVHTLASPTTAGVRILQVDRKNMVAGDTLHLKVNSKVLTGGTIREQHHWCFTGLPSAAVFESIPLTLPYGGTFTLTQSAGTGRAYDWALLSFGSVAVESSGTQSATIGTEHSLATPTTSKTRVLRVDTINLTTGDLVLLRVKTKVLSGGTVAAVHSACYWLTQSSPIVESPPIATGQGGTFSLQQITAVGRSFDWSVCTLD